MNLQHFVIEGNDDLDAKALRFLAARAECRDKAAAGMDSGFAAAGTKMSRAYLELSEAIGVGTGFFPNENGSKATLISVERFKGETYLRMPEGHPVLQQPGLVRISADDYINMRAKASTVLQSAADRKFKASFQPA